jgi:ligand-binding SRPBCC domain-containing protein
MKLYHLKKTQFLPITISEAWEFFSSPLNLAKVTPSHLRFKILYISGSGIMYAGQIIRYHVTILPGIKVHWVTEITHVNELHHFIDEQRFGPYALWHHQHHFKEVLGGIEMTDELNYALPLGWIGELANRIFVGGKVNSIFEHRYKVLEQYFSKSKKNILTTI